MIIVQLPLEVIKLCSLSLGTAKQATLKSKVLSLFVLKWPLTNDSSRRQMVCKFKEAPKMSQKKKGNGLI